MPTNREATDDVRSQQDQSGDRAGEFQLDGDNEVSAANSRLKPRLTRTAPTDDGKDEEDPGLAFLDRLNRETAEDIR